MRRYLLRRYWWRLLGKRWLGPSLDSSSDSRLTAIQRIWYTCEPILGKEVRRPGYADVYRVTRILPNEPHWGGGVWGVRTGQQESTEAAAEWAAAKVNNLRVEFPSPHFYETSIYWMRTRFHLSRKVCINILEQSLLLRRGGGGHHLRWKN
jgi:hypothetical protein